MAKLFSGSEEPIVYRTLCRFLSRVLDQAIQLNCMKGPVFTTELDGQVFFTSVVVINQYFLSIGKRLSFQ